MIKVKLCKECKKQLPVTKFRRYHSSKDKLRYNCSKCEQKLHDIYKKRNKLSWIGIIPKITKCELCNTVLHFDGNKNTINYDHKNEGKEQIGKSPTNWLEYHKKSEENIEIWKESGFGFLCQRCNRSLPTKNRKLWVFNLVGYTFGEKVKLALIKLYEEISRKI